MQGIWQGYPWVFWGCARGIKVKCGEYAGNVLSICENYGGDLLGI